MSVTRRGLWGASLFASVGVVVLLGLGTWQIERKAWKEALIATLEQRLGAEPLPLPPITRWSELTRATDEFTRVKFRAAFLPGRRVNDPEREARVYTSGSALRDDVKAPGYFVFAPARLPDGSTVVVNRGYVANPRPTPATPPVPLPTGPVDATGVIRFADAPGWFDQTYNATDDLWFVRDPLAMAARNGWGFVAPFYVEMETPAPPAGAPKLGRINVNLRNEHLQYAITWYSLALVLIVVFGLWARARRSAIRP